MIAANAFLTVTPASAAEPKSPGWTQTVTLAKSGHFNLLRKKKTMKYTITRLTVNDNGFVIATLKNVTDHNGGSVTDDPTADHYFEGLGDLKVGDEIVIA